MDQLLKKLHTQFKLLEDLTDLSPEEEKEFKERMAAERNKESRYQEYKNAQQADDSSNSGSDVTKMSASELVKELHTALDREGIKIPNSGGNPVEDILAAIQTYKKSMNLPTDADALVKLFRLTPPTNTSSADSRAVRSASTNTSTPNTDTTDKGVAGGDIGAFTAADMAATAAAKPEEEEPVASKIGSYVGNALGATVKHHYNMAKQAGQYGLDALTGAAKGAVKGWDSVKENHNTSRSLSESDEMSLLVSKLKRLDETTQLNEVRLPPAVEKLADDFGWLFKRRPQAEVADALGKTPVLRLTDGTEVATGWTRLPNTNMFSGPNGRTLDAKALAKELKQEGSKLEKTFGVPKGSQVTDTASTGTITSHTKNADGSWVKQDGTVIPRGSNEAIALEREAQRRLTSSNTSTTSPTSSPTSTPKPPTGPTASNPAANILKPNSLPANLSWAAKSKRFLKYAAALAALDLVFNNGDLIMSGVGKIADYARGSETPDAAPGTSSDNATATDAKNSEEIKRLVKEIQDLQQKHGKDSDPAWSKAVERANAVFKKLGYPPFDNSIPKPKPVAPAPGPVAPPPKPAKPAAPEPAIPPESVVPQGIVVPAYQQQPQPMPPQPNKGRTLAPPVYNKDNWN